MSHLQYILCVFLVRARERAVEDVLARAASAAAPRADALAERHHPARFAQLVDFALDHLRGVVVLRLDSAALAVLELCHLRAHRLEAVDAVAQALRLVVILARHGVFLLRVNLPNLARGHGVDVQVQGHVRHPGVSRRARAGRQAVVPAAAQPVVHRRDGFANHVQRDDAHLVVDVQLVHVALVHDDAQDGGVHVDVHGLELARLVAGRGVGVEAEVPETPHDRAVQACLAGGQQTGEELDLRRDLVLVAQELDLVDPRGVVQPKHELLRELGEARALPPARLGRVEVELARGVIGILRFIGKRFSNRFFSHEGCVHTKARSRRSFRRARTGRDERDAAARGGGRVGEWRYARGSGSGVVASGVRALETCSEPPARERARVRRSTRLTFPDCARQKTRWFGFGLDRVAAFGRYRPSAGHGAMAPPSTARSDP